MDADQKQRAHRLKIETLRARIEMDQLRLKELESAEVGIASENDVEVMNIKLSDVIKRPVVLINDVSVDDIKTLKISVT